MTTPTKEQRAEAARLYWSEIDAEVQHWIDTGNTDFPHGDTQPCCEGIAGQAGNIAQALADRDARIGELVTEALESAALLVTAQSQLARVVGALDELLGAEGCSCECEHHQDEHEDECKRCFACRVDAVLREVRSG